ncbi:MAG: DUF1992 domain-containing protein [Chloroflexota bacterium]
MAMIDEQIQDAMRKGHFADLPGAGKPLRLDNDAHVPEQMRMANKLMRDNDLVPEWMAQGKELDAEREKLSADLRRTVQRGASVEALREAAKKHNSRILSYNLKVPQGVVHKRHFDLDQELQKLR